MSENPTSFACRAAVAGSALALVLALPSAALAGGKHHDHDHDGHHHWNGKVVCNYLEKKSSKWHAVFCPQPPAPPAPAPAPAPTAPSAQQQADVIVNIVNQPTAPVVGDQTVAAPAPAAAPAAVPAAAPVRAAASSGSCEKRTRFRISLHKGRVRAARVLLNGKAISVTRGKRRTNVLIDVRGRKNTAFTVRHLVVLRNGRLKTGTRRFRTCA
jgi:hypothetical protein